jgi:AhpD family alkylhydroperoxidase
VTDHNHDHGRGVLSQLAPEGRELKALIPGVYEGFAQLHNAAFAEGVLDKKTKELLALAIAIAVRCDGCIASHARGAAVNKATEAWRLSATSHPNRNSPLRRIRHALTNSSTIRLCRILK